MNHRQEQEVWYWLLRHEFSSKNRVDVLSATVLKFKKYSVSDLIEVVNRFLKEDTK